MRHGIGIGIPRGGRRANVGSPPPVTLFESWDANDLPLGDMSGVVWPALNGSSTAPGIGTLSNVITWRGNQRIDNTGAANQSARFDISSVLAALPQPFTFFWVGTHRNQNDRRIFQMTDASVYVENRNPITAFAGLIGGGGVLTSPSDAIIRVVFNGASSSIQTLRDQGPLTNTAVDLGVAGVDLNTCWLGGDTNPTTGSSSSARFDFVAGVQDDNSHFNALRAIYGIHPAA